MINTGSDNKKADLINDKIDNNLKLIKSSKMNKEKPRNLIVTCVFLGYILFFSLGSFIVNDRKFSDMENRNLEQFPKLSSEAILSGEFMEDIEKYMSDQIILKDQLVKSKVSFNYLLNQKFTNGVFFGQNDFIIQDYLKPYGQIDTNIEYVNLFAKDNLGFDITWFIVPNASCVYKDKLPILANTYDQSEVMAYLTLNIDSKINVVNPANALISKKDDELYYKTDHHWTMKGAYIGYVELCNSLGVIPTEMKDYQIEEGSSDFYGSLYSKAPTFWQKPDTILLYNKKDGEYQVDYVDEGISCNSLYNFENLRIKDKYTTYLDGNHSRIIIKSNSSNKKKILVIKDSYAHSLLPLLADNFNEIHVVDLRYFHQSVSQYAKDNQISDIIFINNLDFISTDNNFLWLQ